MINNGLNMMSHIKGVVLEISYSQAIGSWISSSRLVQASPGQSGLVQASLGQSRLVQASLGQCGDEQSWNSKAMTVNGIFGLETLIWNFGFGTLAWDLQLRNFSLAPLAQKLQIGILLRNFSLRSLAQELQLLGLLCCARDLSLGTFRLGSFARGTWAWRLEEPVDGHWGGTGVAGLVCLVFKKLSKNPSR